MTRKFPGRGGWDAFAVTVLLVLLWPMGAWGDTGVSGLNIPDTICAWRPIFPEVVVSNYGNLTEWIDVFCEIDSLYTTIYMDSQSILLGPGNQAPVTFREWQPNGPGNTYTVTVYISPPDTNPSNDTVSVVTTTIPCEDRGVTGLNIPDTICAWQPISPAVLLCNGGSYSDTIPVFCEIDSVDTTIYVDTAWVYNVFPGDTVCVPFREWEPNGPGNTYEVTAYLSPPDTNPSNDTVSIVTTTILCPGVEELFNDQLPMTNFQLFQNCPNPFSRSTVITYSLAPRPGDTETRGGGDLSTYQRINLSVYDLSGRLIRVLADYPSNHPTIQLSNRVHWDGKDVRGKEAPSGIYLCRLVVGDWVATKKMVLLR